MAEKVYTIVWVADGAERMMMQEEYAKIGKALDRYAEMAKMEAVGHVLFVEGFVLTESHND